MTSGITFKDTRLQTLLPRYIARNFPRNLTSEQRAAWDDYRTKRLMNGLPGQLSLTAYAERLAELVAVKADDEASQFVLQELQLYAENIAPIDEG